MPTVNDENGAPVGTTDGAPDGYMIPFLPVNDRHTVDEPAAPPQVAADEEVQ